MAENDDPFSRYPFGAGSHLHLGNVDGTLTISLDTANATKSDGVKTFPASFQAQIYFTGDVKYRVIQSKVDELFNTVSKRSFDELTAARLGIIATSGRESEVAGKAEEATTEGEQTGGSSKPSKPSKLRILLEKTKFKLSSGDNVAEIVFAGDDIADWRDSVTKSAVELVPEGESTVMKGTVQFKC